MMHTKVYRILFSLALLLMINRVNCNAKTTCTNSSGEKPDLGLDQDQQ